MSTPSERFFQSPEPITIGDDVPLVFLEGPVQGAPDWQTPFAHRLLEALPGIAVASPRANPEHEANFRSKDPEVKKRTSDQQVVYEFITRRRAFQYGAIAMWYATQDPSLPYPSGRRYGKTTPIENGEAWGWLAHQPTYPFIVGFDPDFVESGENSRGYIHRNHQLMGVPEYNSLDDVFDATVAEVAILITEGPQPAPASIFRSAQQALDRLDSK